MLGSRGMAKLPELRDELSLYKGPDDRDGSPTWNLLDPARNLFFQLPWPSVEILSRWGLGAPGDIAQSITKETTLEVAEDDVTTFSQFLIHNQLTQAPSPEDTQRFDDTNAAAKQSWIKWALHKYLFFRIPLVRPDAFLEATLGYVEWAFSRNFRLLTLLALVSGLFLAGRQWDVFVTSFVDMFTMGGIVLYGLAYLFVKTIHELGHAYSAKRFGCKVATMGLAFMVMWPVLYTDTNEAWKLSVRRQRIAIAAAGVLAELAVAVWATLAWSLLPDGELKTVAFLLATTTWISSIAINFSPFMRFDGYFLLMDFLDVPNLHSRSFALARWKVRAWLFGAGEPAPESFSRGRAAFLIIFAFFTWIYRLVLFLGIALLVYHFFIKVVGIVLFAVELVWFVVRPVWVEMKVWRKTWDKLKTGRRTPYTLGALAILMALFVIPWHGRISLPAVWGAESVVVIYAPFGAIVEKIGVREKQAVLPEQSLIKLYNPDLDYELAQAQRQISSLTTQVDAGTISKSFSERRNVLFENLQRAIAEAEGLRKQKEKQTLKAPISGVIVDVLPDLMEGEWIAEGEALFSIRGQGAPVIEAYVTEKDLHRLEVGAHSTFVPDNPEGTHLKTIVVSIGRTALRSLNKPYLASLYGGPVAVRPTEKLLVPEQALYRVNLRILNNLSPPAMEMRGSVHVDAPAESLASGLWRSIAIDFLRESGM